MNLDNQNSLIELFFSQVDKQDKKSIFLQWLNPNNKKTFTWEEVEQNIFKLSKVIKENIQEGDRCLLVSENRTLTVLLLLDFESNASTSSAIRPKIIDFI